MVAAMRGFAAAAVVLSIALAAPASAESRMGRTTLGFCPSSNPSLLGQGMMGGALRGLSPAVAPQAGSAILGASLFGDGRKLSRKSVGGVVGANMMFDQLSSSIEGAIKKLAGKKTITEDSISGALKDIRRSLLEADVNLAVANSVVEEVKKKAVGAAVVDGVNPAQQFVKIMNDELTRILGGEQAPLARVDGGITKILMAGLQGTGKTTATAKLALYCQQQDPPRKVLLVACDVYRPAAIEQLQTLAGQVGCEVFQKGTEENPRTIAREALAYAEENGFDTVIVDTAGRQVVDQNLMTELKDVKHVVQPDEVLLVVDAMTGQEAANLTKSFNDVVGITGAILTKLDGDTRGGAALSVQTVSGKPIKFVGVGEKVEALEAFYPERMASRILGMGDVVSFVEKAQKIVDEKEAEEMAKKMMAATFDFDDFLKQSNMVKQMGNMAGMLKMMPGGGGIKAGQLAEAEQRMKVAESLICSMTKRERKDPSLLIGDITAASRLRRIAKGAGRTERQAQELMSDFQRMKVMMQNMAKMAMSKQGAPAPNASADPSAAFGNRSARRSGGKAGKKAMPKARGFGAK